MKKQTIEILQEELSELKKLYHDLQIREERYHVLAQNALDVIWTMKLDGTITFISPAVQDLRSFTVEEAMCQTIDQILTPASQQIVIAYLMKLNADYQAGLPLDSFRGENEYYCKDGSILKTEVIVYPRTSKYTDEITLFGVTRDIRVRKEYEAQLIDQATKLKELNATKDKFFSILAHDLKSPFQGVLGISKMMKDHARDYDADTIIKLSEGIYRSAEKTYELLENLLDWAKIEQSSFPFSPQNIRLDELIINELDILSYNADQKGIRIKSEIPKGIHVEADPKMISSIVRNLLSNAIKFTPRSGIVSIQLKEMDQSVEIEVRDTGIGMTNEEIGRLFAFETSFTNRGTDDEKGSGLGLLLCKDFVDRHKGKIQVTSKLGNGSSFRIILPG